MKHHLLAYCLVVIAAETTADHHKTASNHHVEEIVVSAPFQKSSAETAMPVNVLSGEHLRKSVANNLGDTLRNQVGVHSASFGPGVGQAVIRGQSGNRVQVLQNSVNTVDAASVSPDHANGIEPLLARSLEVVRGPSTLLYGNGAVGGIVNVIDERIPERRFDAPEVAIEHSFDSVSNEHKSVVRLNASPGLINLHLDGMIRDNDDVDISGFAIDETALMEAGHDDIEITNSRGFIANSDSDADGATLGASISGNWGFIGVAANDLNQEYGLPPGTHEHEEAHDPAEPEEEMGQVLTRIALKQTRYDLAGEYHFDEGFFQKLRGSVSYTRYEHRELEVQTDASKTVGTVFQNDGIESRFVLNHRPVRNWTGVWGLQLADTRFSALGEESFIPKTSKHSLALFAVEQLEMSRWTWEFGLRLEQLRLDPGSHCEQEKTTSSLGASLLFDAEADGRFMFSLARSERAPTIEELYSNIEITSCSKARDDSALVFHAATALFEIGNPDLGKETSTNFELGYRKDTSNWSVELNLFHNQIRDYAFLENNTSSANVQDIATFRARDARFYGLELESSMALPFLTGNQGDLEISLQGDLVRATFDTGGNVPRIPPARLGVSLTYYAANWSLDLRAQKAFTQSHSAHGESYTDGYTRLSLYADYHLEVGGTELLFFAKGTNLLDQEIRDHASLLKNIASQAGAGIRLGIRFTY